MRRTAVLALSVGCDSLIETPVRYRGPCEVKRLLKAMQQEEMALQRLTIAISCMICCYRPALTALPNNAIIWHCKRLACIFCTL